MVLQAFKLILLALLPLVFSQAGCGEPAPRGKRVLVDHFRWALSDVPSEHYQAPPEDLECDTELNINPTAFKEMMGAMFQVTRWASESDDLRNSKSRSSAAGMTLDKKGCHYIR